MKEPRTRKLYIYYRNSLKSKMRVMRNEVIDVIEENVVIIKYISVNKEFLKDFKFNYKEICLMHESEYRNIKLSLLIYASSRKFKLIDVDLNYKEKIELIANIGLLINNIRKIFRLRKKIEQFRIFRTTSYELYSKILMKYNNEMSKYILKGYRLRLGGSVGKIYLILADLDLSNKHENKRIEWGKTYKNLLSLTSKFNNTTKDLLKEHIEGRLKRFDFYALANTELKKYGIKWFIYGKSDIMPLIKWQKHIGITNNSRYYRFSPSAYNYTGMLYEEYLEKVEDVDQIINDDNIGLRDKTHQINRFDNNFFNTVIH